MIDAIAIGIFYGVITAFMIIYLILLSIILMRQVRLQEELITYLIIMVTLMQKML